MRNADADLLGRDLLDRVRFVEYDEVIREQKTALTFFLLLGIAKKHEEQSVIEHDHIRREQFLARLLIKTARILAASFLGADVRFTANLRPHFRIRFDR